MKTLKDVKVGETCTVARLHGEGPVKRRIAISPSATDTAIRASITAICFL